MSDIRKQLHDFYLFLLRQHRVARIPYFFAQVEALTRVLFDQSLSGLIYWVFLDALDLIFGWPPVSSLPHPQLLFF